MKQEIIELVRLSAAESVGDAGFSSPRISVRCRSLIGIKSVSKSAKYFGQLFVSIIAPRGFDRERVEDVGLLVAKLLVLGLAGASSELGSLSTGTILGPGTGETGETVRTGWIVLEGDLEDEQPR